MFNKTASDFSSLKEYNDYLEEVEDIVEDMIRGTPQQKDAANKKIKKYKFINFLSFFFHFLLESASSGIFSPFITVLQYFRQV